jgi:hypothetical protein
LPGSEGAALTVFLTATGQPIRCDSFPRGEVDPRAVCRWGVGGPNSESIGWVSDWAVLSRSLLEATENAPIPWVLGAALHTQPQTLAQALGVGRLPRVRDDLHAKEALVDGRRHIVFRDRRQAVQDAADRKVLVQAFRQELELDTFAGDPSLDMRDLGAVNDPFTIDQERVKQDARLDGLVVLRTNLDWPVEEVVALYQRSTRLIQLLAGLPPLPPAGPVFWKSAAYQQGRICCTALALLLGHELDRRLRARGLNLSWPEIRQHLQTMMQLRVPVAGRQYWLHPQPDSEAVSILQALDIPLPALIDEVPQQSEP